MTSSDRVMFSRMFIMIMKVLWMTIKYMKMPLMGLNPKTTNQTFNEYEQLEKDLANWK